ncbi:hypothetical protein GCM10010095_83410 [Streptomyces anthocyanicus]|nr:hypothetical protein GCM10010095_83410 [Streptomyces anthocyanicus]
MVCGRPRNWWADTSTDAVAHLRRLRGLLLERRARAEAVVAAIDRELEARAKGVKVTPEEQLEMLGARFYDVICGAYPPLPSWWPRNGVARPSESA